MYTEEPEKLDLNIVQYWHNGIKIEFFVIYYDRIFEFERNVFSLSFMILVKKYIKNFYTKELWYVSSKIMRGINCLT